MVCSGGGVEEEPRSREGFAEQVFLSVEPSDETPRLYSTSQHKVTGACTVKNNTVLYR